MTSSVNPGVLFNIENLFLIICRPFQNAWAFISPSEVFKMRLRVLRETCFFVSSIWHAIPIKFLSFHNFSLQECAGDICGLSLHRNVLWQDIKLLPKLREIICLMWLWFFYSWAILNSSCYSFSISEAGKQNSRNLCRGSSWLSHFQWRFLLEKLSMWSLLNRVELGNKLSEQLKPNQLWSEYYGDGNVYFFSFWLLHFYQVYFWLCWPLSVDSKCL